jgi:dTDP-4-dehydrorhamnose reductase
VLKNQLEEIRPTIIIIKLVPTAVEKQKTERETADIVNHQAVKIIYQYAMIIR